MTDCQEVLKNLYLCLDGELSPDRVAEVERHFEECRSCLERYGAERAFKELLRRRCVEPAPPDLAARIRTALEREIP